MLQSCQNYLILKFRAIRKQRPSKSPREKFDTFHKFGGAITNLIGTRLLSDMKIDWYCAVPGAMSTIYFILNFYTVHYYFTQNEFVKLIEYSYLDGAVIAVHKILTQSNLLFIITFQKKK